MQRTRSLIDGDVWLSLQESDGLQIHLVHRMDLTRDQRVHSGRGVADAEHFEPQRVFGRSGFDRLFISYAVSMIPSWRSVMAEAFVHLAPGGELHVVDFGDQQELPSWFRSGLRTWLRWYHVTPRLDLFDVAADIAAAGGGNTMERRLYRGFVWLVVLRKPAT